MNALVLGAAGFVAVPAPSARRASWLLAARLQCHATGAVSDLDTVRAQMTSLDGGIDMVNESVERILSAIRDPAKGGG
ncbi:MAG: hypothetical protein ACRDMZ_23875 [Solirubrobacteraceae bacterium]